MAAQKSDIGLIGLAVMGQNLALNIESKGFPISVYNRTTEKTIDFVQANPDRKPRARDSPAGPSFSHSIAPGPALPRARP